MRELSFLLFMAENFGPFETNLTTDVVDIHPASLNKKCGLSSVRPLYATLLVRFAVL